MTDPKPTGNLWAIVLAGGEGTRLASVTQAVHGLPIPKQFALLGRDGSFLQRTIDRIAPLVPPSRTVVVVSESYAELAEAQLARYPGVVLVGQPANRGTGVGLLLPLSSVLAADPDASVVVFPSDHHVRSAPHFLDAVRRAVWAAKDSATGVVLVGAAADSPATDLGWIVPGFLCDGDARARGVAGFVEKPDEEAAADLLRRGALWNTLVIAARGEGLWSLARAHAPEVVATFDRYRAILARPGAEAWLRAAYAHLATVDLSRDILEPAEGLRVVRMLDAGWCDCGTPERLLRSMGTVQDGQWPRTRLGQVVAQPLASSAVCT